MTIFLLCWILPLSFSLVARRSLQKKEKNQKNLLSFLVYISSKLDCFTPAPSLSYHMWREGRVFSFLQHLRLLCFAIIHKPRAARQALAIFDM